MALDQQQTFNWLVSEKARLESEVEALRVDCENWRSRCFDMAFEVAKNNPAIQAEIMRARDAETPDASILNFVLRSNGD